MTCLSVVCSAVCLGTLVGPPAPPEAVPLERVVALLIRDLGAERYDARERATESLRRIGFAALSALEEAARSEDPEVRVRAQQILGDVRLGIGPDWPSDMVLLVRHYDRLSESGRRSALRRMADVLAERAVPFFLRRMATSGDSEAAYALSCLQRVNSEEAAQRVVALLKEPKNRYEAKALAWARSLTGGALEALQILTAAQIDDGMRNQAIEAGVKETLAKLKDRKHEEAAQSAHRFAKAAPDEPRFPYLEAEACVALDRDDRAGALRGQALALNPEAEGPHYIAGQMLGKLGRRRLAAREWEAILRIPPADGVYDINAHLRLGSIYGASGLFERAAASLAKALELLAMARQAGRGMGMVGGDEESVRMEIQNLLRKARRFPAAEDADIEDKLGENELRVQVNITVKDGKFEELRRALADVVATLSMEVQPHGLRLFEVAPVSLRYDPAKRQIRLLLRESPCAKPIPFEAGAGEARIVVNVLDCCYIFNVNAATGEVRRIARFEKDYTVRVVPGIKVAAYADVTAKINRKRYDWDELLKGVAFDYLPKEFDIVVEGTTPSGARTTSHFKGEFKEPPIGPKPDAEKPAGPEPEPRP